MLDKHNPGIAIIHGITPPKILCEELIFFYTKPTHQPNSDVRMVDNLSKRMFLCIPTHLSTKRQLLYPTLHVLFSCLSPSAIVHLYSCILLEYNVLFTSHDMHKLTLSVVAITQLIQPFETQAILIPLLPDSLKQILQSPVPYIIGSIQSEKDGPDVIVNLDKGTVESKKGFPMVPHADKLMADIQKIINSSSESILTPKKHLKSVFGTEQKKRNPDFDKFIRSTNSFVFPSEFTKNISMKYIFTQFVIEDIIGLFESFFPPILDDLIKCYFVTDNTDPDLSVTVLNKELLLSTIDEKDKEFYSAFITTQTFETYCNQVMDNCSKEK
ncbi:uDENN domain containing protein [Histomonas meleagridis]|uniref:uDENN domain containing protein n=1 Tax=Histomonas meleagridis TaxID=135588 RepID=UPI003559B204|nr:uDENN domain containing protein [Histomonas meleagridis]KAH0802592.1 uDENN domain containing protein [Histomonas meleagridis]